MASDSTEPIEVTVEIAGAEVIAGTLRVYERRGQSTTFEYAIDYVARPGAYELDPAMPLALGVMQPPLGRTLFNAFTDCAPDRWGRQLMVRAEDQRAASTKTARRTLGDADFLLGTRDVLRQGAVRLRRPATTDYYAKDGSGLPQLVALPRLLAASNRFIESGGIDVDLRDLLAAGSSLGGARPKAAVMTSSGELALAKFPRRDTDSFDVPAWEMVTHELARRSGIAVSPATLVNVAGQNVFVVQRFDRSGHHRLGFASALTMLEGTDQVPQSYLGIAEVIERHGNNVELELAELFRRIAFSILVSNADDHLRNHGFIRDGLNWVLSPAYDMNPNPERTDRLTTAIDETSPDTDPELLLSVATLFRLKDPDARKIIGEVEEATASWADVASTYSIPRHQIALMRTAFDAPQRAMAKDLV